MNNRYFIGNAILWAAAIVGAAVLHAPAALSGLILPSLAVCSLLIVGAGSCSRGPGE
ncbi:MAG: hypothetical protein M3Y80_04865 [Verrucomicrobiota bacterium]|nr:hypothetical protein [Verrucomicrobiota bacterium]